MKVVDRATVLNEPFDFSLVLGGPLYQLWRRAHLSGDTLDLLYRRIVTIVLVVWLPLLILSAVGGHAVGETIKIPFLRDFEVHTRFLVALPLLIAAELLVHVRNRIVVKRFVDRNIVSGDELPKFQAAIEWAVRVRNSIPLEVALVILVWTVGHWIWLSQIALSTETWYATMEATRWHLTPAGYWYAFVSVPVFQFILLRWYLRLFIWFGFLWRVSRLNLRLTATHPDRAGGIAFLGKSAYPFAPFLVAQSALLSGMIANRVLYEGDVLQNFKMEAASLVVFFVVVVLGPLVMFAPKLTRAKRKGLGEYGLLATNYVQDFEEKWVHGKAPHTEGLLGTADIQSLADLANSYAVIREMRIVPFGLEDVTRLVLTTAAPLVPLGLLVLSLEDLVVRLVKILF